MKKGKIVQVSGPVIDVEFEDSDLPFIKDALEVNNEYCFLGDGLYAMQKGFQSLYNTGILKEEIDVLKKVKAKNFMCSHKTPFGRSKAGVIRWLESIYDMRTKDNPYILYE